MTFLEKVKKDNPNIKLKDSGIPMACPFELGYEEDYDCEEVKCIDCWNREMPNTEPRPKEDMDREDYRNLGYNEGLNDGRNEVWEFVSKVYSIMSYTKVHEVFNCQDLGDVLREYSPQEALAKLKAYEEPQIEVGDVVEMLVGTKCVVSYVKDGYAEGITEHGCGFYNIPICDLKKTGKHINIQNILEQIGENRYEN